ncbi:hypothetical protein AAZX31_19G048700 [Glycine max]
MFSFLSRSPGNCHYLLFNYFLYTDRFFSKLFPTIAKISLFMASSFSRSEKKTLVFSHCFSSQLLTLRPKKLEGHQQQLLLIRENE